jgi:hypothetical protein
MGFPRSPFDEFIIAQLEATYGGVKVRDAFDTVIPTFYKTPNISQCQLPRIVCSMKLTKNPSGGNCVFVARPKLELSAIVMLSDVRVGEELVVFNLLEDMPLLGS